MFDIAYVIAKEGVAFTLDDSVDQEDTGWLCPSDSLALRTCFTD